MYYLVYAKIKQLRTDLETRLKSGFQKDDSVLHEFGADAMTRGPWTVSDMMKLLNTGEQIISDELLVAALDRAVKQRNLIVSVAGRRLSCRKPQHVMPDHRISIEKELLIAIHESSAFAGTEGLINVRRMAPASIFTMMRNKYSDTLQAEIEEAAKSAQIWHQKTAALNKALKDAKSSSFGTTIPSNATSFDHALHEYAHVAENLANVRASIADDARTNASSLPESEYEEEPKAFKRSLCWSNTHALCRCTSEPMRAHVMEQSCRTELLRKYVESQVESEPAQGGSYKRHDCKLNRVSNEPHTFLGAPTDGLAQLQIGAFAFDHHPTIVQSVFTIQDRIDEMEADFVGSNTAKGHLSKDSCNEFSTPSKKPKDAYPLDLYKQSPLVHTHSSPSFYSVSPAPQQYGSERHNESPSRRAPNKQASVPSYNTYINDVVLDHLPYDGFGNPLPSQTTLARTAPSVPTSRSRYRQPHHRRTQGRTITEHAESLQRLQGPATYDPPSSDPAELRRAAPAPPELSDNIGELPVQRPAPLNVNGRSVSAPVDTRPFANQKFIAAGPQALGAKRATVPWEHEVSSGATFSLSVADMERLKSCPPNELGVASIATAYTPQSSPPPPPPPLMTLVPGTRPESTPQADLESRDRGFSNASNLSYELKDESEKKRVGKGLWSKTKAKFSRHSKSSDRRVSGDETRPSSGETSQAW